MCWDATTALACGEAAAIEGQPADRHNKSAAEATVLLVVLLTRMVM